jgi:hypothetical protein
VFGVDAASARFSALPHMHPISHPPTQQGALQKEVWDVYLGLMRPPHSNPPPHSHTCSRSPIRSLSEAPSAQRCGMGIWG